MSKTKELLDFKRDLKLAADFAAIEVKLEIMKIMFMQPTPEAKLAAIIDYLKEDEEDGHSKLD